MNPLQKRNNPFATKINDPEPVQEEINEEFEQEEEEITYSRPVQTKKPVRKQVEEPQIDNNRVKYTSTMNRSVRRAIKILCAERGILFATFVEDACREKLRKEGVL